MTCDEVELMLVTAEPLSADAAAHLGTCEKCRTFQSSSAAVLADAALPAPTAEEKAAQAGLAPRLHQTWVKLERRRSFVRRALGMAVAACVGAAIASAALLPRLQHSPPSPTTVEWAIDEPELVSSLDTEDELDAYEVSWPSLEGDAL